MEDIREYVVFKIDNEYYGIDIKFVENIEKAQSITRVPFAESYLEGVINLRGNIIPVVNLRERFMMESKEITKDTRIIIINFNGYHVGLVVDSSSEVVQFDEENIEKAPKIGDSIKNDFIKEVGKENERIVMLIDIRKVLDIVETESK
ncbi:chemotaxis protein CheW [Clostridiaceae bacterium HSG29]|nr:chemotaxis protein CheW [Clostridiaceae bacterium HSG29]